MISVWFPKQDFPALICTNGSNCRRVINEVILLNFLPFALSHQSPSSHICDCAMASLCQSQQRCVKASIVSSWRLAEAQDQLCSLGVHSSESLEQERARTLACPTELTHTEEEWRRKESMLGSLEPSRSPVLGAVGSWNVFDKVSVQTKIMTGNLDLCHDCKGSMRSVRIY